MGIFQKLSTVLKSNINDLIARAENPEKMLNQIILDMRDQLAKAKREVAAAIADERKLRAQLDDEVKQTRDWEHRAMLAVKEGRDDLAKQALIRQQEHAQRAATIDQTWTAQAQETEKLKGSLRQLNDKIEEAKRKRNLLIAKQKRAQAQKRIHETMSGLSDTSAFEAFNRMAEKIEESERRTVAQVEVNEAALQDSEYLYMEGYLVTSDSARGAAIHTRKLAQQHGVKTAISLSDPGMVEFFSEGLREMIGEQVDLLFCNEDEALAWTGTSSVALAAEALKQDAASFAITLGGDGALVYDGQQLIEIAPHPVQAIDTNGAGDMFAGAFLYAISHGHDFASAGLLACRSAAELVCQYGPRLPADTHSSLLSEVLKG